MSTSVNKNDGSEQTASQRLNLYLFLDSVNSFDECIKQPGDARKHADITGSRTIANLDYKILLIEGEEKHPKWYSLIQEHIQSDQEEILKFQTRGVVILLSIKIANQVRFFALTGGFCYYALNRENIELNFGLYTALNSVKPEVKLFDARRIESQSTQKRVASNVATHLSELGFEYDSDILRIISGTCADDKFGTSVTGSDSLHLTSKVTLDQMPEKLSSIFSVYKSDAYKTNFKDIDYIQPERNKASIDKLNQQLLDAINNRMSSLKLSMAYPDQIDYSRCDYFKISSRKIPRKSQMVSDVSIPIFYSLLDAAPPKTSGNVTFDELKNIKIIGFSDENAPLTSSDSVFNYLVFETDEVNGKKHVLSGGSWYCINADYIAEVDAELLRKIPAFSATPTLLAWSKIRNKKGIFSYDEGNYNEQYKNNSEYLYLDKQWFQNFGAGNKKSRMEIADLFHFNSKKLLCVKKGREAASLSALWSQGTVSADLFTSFLPYRDEFIRRVKQRWPGEANKITSELIRELTFTFAIGVDSAYANIVALLPVFSRINLMRHVRALEKMSFKVEVAIIQQV